MRIKLGRTGALAALAALLVVIGGPAQAAPATKVFKLTIPAATTPGSYTLTLSNSNDSTHTLASANVTVPAGFTVTSVGAASATGKSWSANLVGTTIELRAAQQADAIEPGTEVTSTLTLQGCSSEAWKAQAKQSNSFNGPPGNDFKHPDPFPVVTGARGAPVTLAFVRQPSLVERGSAISPSVKIGAVDACGNPATGTVAMAIGFNPAGGTLHGTLSQPLDAQGIAEFSDLEIDKSGVGYKLSASSGAVSESVAFNVVDYLCRSADYCEGEDEDGNTTVRTDGVPSGGAMAMSFDGFAGSFSCGASPLTGAGSLVNIDPIGYPTNAPSIAVTMRWSKSEAPGTGVTNFTFCWSKTDSNYSVAGACTKKGQLPAGVKLCELKRHRNGAGELVIGFLIAAEDPYAGLGR
ncbi:MAG: hypothetical protein H0T13_06405 [Actinobacteria bacterium]|nr:hypothetical protein [Actinomycetota bacterium]